MVAQGPKRTDPQIMTAWGYGDVVLRSTRVAHRALTSYLIFAGRPPSCHGVTAAEYCGPALLNEKKLSDDRKAFAVQHWLLRISAELFSRHWAPGCQLWTRPAWRAGGNLPAARFLAAFCAAMPTCDRKAGT